MDVAGRGGDPDACRALMESGAGAPDAPLAEHRGDGACGAGGDLQHGGDEVESQPEVVIGKAARSGYGGAGTVHQGIRQRIGDPDGDIFMFCIGRGEGQGHGLHRELRVKGCPSLAAQHHPNLNQ